MRGLSRYSLFLIAAMLVLATGKDAAASDDVAFPARTAACLYQSPDNGKEGRIVLYLSAFDQDGTTYYRTLTAPPLEIKVLPDGKIATDPNPCRSDLAFKD